MKKFIITGLVATIGIGAGTAGITTTAQAMPYRHSPTVASKSVSTSTTTPTTGGAKWFSPKTVSNRVCWHPGRGHKVRCPKRR